MKENERMSFAKLQNHDNHICIIQFIVINTPKIVIGVIVRREAKS